MEESSLPTSGNRLEIGGIIWKKIRDAGGPQPSTSTRLVACLPNKVQHYGKNALALNQNNRESGIDEELLDQDS